MKFYKTIKQKLAVNVIIVVAAFLITAAVVQFFTDKMTKGSLNILLNANATKTMMAAQTALVASHSVVLHSLRDKSHYNANQLRQSARILESEKNNIAQLRDNMLSDQGRMAAAMVIKLSDKAIVTLNSGADLMASGADPQAFNRWYDDVYVKSIDPFFGMYAKVIETLEQRMPVAKKLVLEGRATVTKVNLGLILFFVLITGFLLGAVARNLSQRVDQLNQVMSQVKDGDLRVAINSTGEDEIADISHSLDELVAHLRDLVSGVQQRMQEVNRQSSELQAIVVNNSSTADLVNDQMTMLSTAMTEMSYTIGEVAKNAEGAASGAQQANTQAAEGEQRVVTMARDMKSLNQAVTEATSKVGALSDNTANISSILDVIRGIAEQTNLLALNAAIEAARAGEQGRGFAVVADEVRTLATRTQESTNEISDVIQGLQQNSSETVTIMSDVESRAESVAENAVGTETSLKGIVGSIDEISMMNSQIATAAEEQSATANEINVNVSEVVNMANDQNAKTQKAGEIAQSLHASAEYVEEQLNYFSS
ncbi:methyl-accepting chemotaxis protein [Candidatus Pelagadaptatus aseana]|uniref:methyl-accepting chemotaxis protein n=1 Tax=Candidatus Pelagadaptatus aseana TaxID=3120508 RepID=UPI003C6EF11E